MDAQATTTPHESELWPIERRWLVPRKDGDPQLLSTHDLHAFRASVLLGAAGSGKTIEAKNLADVERATGRDVRECRLAEYAGSSDELARHLTSLVTNANSTTVIYFDALDEAMVPLRRAWLTIRNWVTTHLGRTGASVRITCRSAVWPKQLSTSLRVLSGDDGFALAQLQPLTDADIATAGAAFGVDTVRFAKALTDRRATTLAMHPLTLRMLLKLFASSQGLPTTLRDLFHDGLRLLADDRFERFEAGTSLAMSPDEIVTAAERLACYSVLCGRDTIDLSDAPPVGHLSWRGLTTLSDGDTPFTRESLRTIGSSGVCDAVSPASFRFGHRQFAEYLAGSRLARLLPHQARALLASPAGWKAGVAGPLRETASFAAMASPEIASWVAHNDPEVVGLSDVADPALRRTATLGLLDRFRSGQMTDAQLSRGELLLHGFQYSDAEQDLRDVLRERGPRCEDVLECAIELIENWRPESMSEDLADLVLDATAPHHPRVAAGYALFKFATVEARERLKPLITNAPNDVNDVNDELKGLALRCNWPERLSVPELLNALTPRSTSSFHGAYDGMLWQLDQESFSAAGHRAKGLRWAMGHFSSQGDTDPAHRIAVKIVHAALQEVDDPAIATELVRLLQYCAAQHINSPLRPLRRSAFSTLAEEPDLVTPLQGDPAIRRQLIDLLASTTAEPKDLWWLAHETPGLCSLDDFLWLLERASDATRPMDIRKNYLQLTRWMQWASRSECVDAWLAVRQVEPVRSALAFPTSVQIESEEADKAREDWQMMSGQRESPKAEILDPPPGERVLRYLDLSEAKDSRFFFDLCREMTLEPKSTHYGFERFLTRSPGWEHADDNTRTRIVEAAKRLLVGGVEDPHSCRKQPLSTILSGCMTAMWLVLEVESNWLSCRDSDWWERWCWYILRELRPHMHNEPESPKKTLMGMLCRSTQKGVRREILRLASDHKTPAQSLLSSLLEMLDDIVDPELDEQFCQMLAESKIVPECLATVMQFVLARLPAKAIPVCKQMLSTPGPDEEHLPAVQAAVSLMFERPSTEWRAIAECISANEERGQQILGRFAHGSRFRSRLENSPQPLEELTPTQWGELVALLLGLFPPESDTVRQGACFVGPSDSARDLRDRLISALGDRDDDESVAALRQLEQTYGSQYPWLRRPRARAERANRLSRWTPIPSEIVADMLHSSTKRLIRSEDDVLAGIEEALEAYERALRQDGPESVEDLWNTPRNGIPSPKDEEHISSKLCGAVRAYFSEYAITADREVEIHRRSVPKGKGGQPGSELDVLVQVPARGAASGTGIRVPLEVKLSCNAQVKTAMKDQLADRYVPQLGTICGIYIVVWMSAPQIGNLQASHRPRWGSIEEARSELDRQATALSQTQGVDLRALVVDGSLR